MSTELIIPGSEDTDINTLYNRDPLSLTKSDIDAIIADMRKRRHLFNKAPTAKAAPKALTAKENAVSKLNIELKL
jgi:hypothetical protein